VRAEGLRLKLNLKQVLVYLTIAFVIVTIWNAPDATGHSVGDFLGSVGAWVADVADRVTTFFKGLTR
jgi:hypothetical protein